MTAFVPTPISVADQDDLRAEARAEMFFALRRAFNKRSTDCGIKAKDLGDILSKDKSYVSRVLKGTNGSIDFETLCVFMNALGYHVPLQPVAIEDLHGKLSNIDCKPFNIKTETSQKSNLYDIRYLNPSTVGALPMPMKTRMPKVKAVHNFSDSDA